MATTLSYFIDKLISEGKEIQFKLKNDGAPGPMSAGKVERLVIEDELGAKHVAYKLHMEAVMQIRPGQATKMILPVVFAAEDVLWFSEGPIGEDGKPAVMTPKDSTPSSGGGIHVPGRR